jgi:hypothetical protein
MSYDPASRIWTGIFFALWVALILVAEVVLLIGRGQGRDWPTLSIYVKDGALFAGFAPVVYGILGGHWFVSWPMASKPWFQGWPVWVALLVVVMASDVLLWGKPHVSYPMWLRVVRHPGVLLLVGIAAGALCWPQRTEL